MRGQRGDAGIERLVLLLGGILAACQGLDAASVPIRSLRGCTQSEVRQLTRQGLSAPALVPAAGLRYSIWRGEESLSTGELDASGCFEVSFASGIGALRVELTTVATAPPEARPLLGIGHQEDSPLSGSYFRFSTAGDATCGAPPVRVRVEGEERASLEPWILREDCGSGAVALFATARAAMTFFDPSLSPVRGQPLPSLGVLWSPGLTSDCIACFRDGPGGSVTIAGTPYTTSLRLSGRDVSPIHWSSSTVAHELGHWAMSAYSRSPGAQGPHSFRQPIEPALAFQEGWASAFGQRVLGRLGGGALAPEYLVMQLSSLIWVDLLGLRADSGPLPLPRLEQGVTQPLNEFVVASALWRLWLTPADLGAPALGIGDQGMLRLLTSPRLREGPDRGVLGPDLLDLLDACHCAGLATPEKLGQVLAPLQFPWDGTPSCP